MNDSQPEARGQGIFIALGFVTLCVAFTLVGFLVYGKAPYPALTNSDLIMPYLLIKGALRDPGILIHWVYPNAMFLMPDWIITFVVLSLPLGTKVMPVAYTGIFFASLALACAFLLRSARVCATLTGLLISSVFLLAILILCLTDPLTTSASLSMSIGAPFIHSGAILLGVITLGICLQHVARAAAPGEKFWTGDIAVACVIAFLGAFSDPLYIGWFVAPIAVIALFLQILLRERLVHLAPIGLITFAAVAGFVIDRMTRPAPPQPAIFDYAESFHVWWQTFWHELGTGGWQFPLAVVLCLPMLVRGVWLIYRMWRAQPFDHADLCEILLIGCSWAALFLPVATGAFVDPALLRYSLPILLLPYLWLGLIVLRLLPAAVVPLTAPAAFLVWIAAAIAWTPQALAASAYFTRLDPLAACLMKNGLYEGYSDYWNAKAIMWNSGYKIHLAQLTDAMVPYRWDFNDEWFHRHVGSKEPFQPRFFVTTRFSNPGLFQQKFGKPDAILDCAGQKVWSYDHVLPLVE